ncbi:MAG: sensor domain-containing diguanylate cyclase [Sulfobacillus sp.]
MTTRGRRNLISLSFALAAVVSLLILVVPRVAPNVNWPLEFAIALVTCAVAGSTRFLPEKLFQRINFGYVAALLVAGAVWSSGAQASPLFPLFYLSAASAASMLRAKRAYQVAAFNALLSLTPLALGLSDAFIRAELLRVPLIILVAATLVRAGEGARFERRVRGVMETINQAGDLSTNVPLASVLSLLVGGLRQVTESEYAIIYLLDDQAQVLNPVAVDSRMGEVSEEARALASYPIAMGQGVTGTVAQEGRPLIVGNMEGHPLAAPLPGTEPTEVSAIFVPLRVQDKLIGILRISRLGANRYGAHDLELTELVAQQAAVAVQNSRLYDETKELYERTRWLSMTDPMTGLFNQRYLGERLPQEVERAERVGQPLSLLMLDSDTLKSINDRYGHDTGDRMIRAIAEVLKSHTRIGDAAVRYAGDEFMLILPDTDAEQAAMVGERVRRAIWDVDLGIDIPISASIGVCASNGNGETAQDLIKGADMALYASKEAGKNRLTVAGRGASPV